MHACSPPLRCRLDSSFLSASLYNTNAPSFHCHMHAQLKRTGTLKVDVQFIPWLSNQNQSSRSSTPALDFTLQRDGVSQELAKDLDLKFRKLPSGASPGLLDWAELTSTLATQMRSSPAAIVSALRVDSSNVITGNSDRDIDSSESQVGTANRGSEGESAEEMRRHHRMARGLSEGRNLAQICSLDNAETDTQASIWADFARKQVN